MKHLITLLAPCALVALAFQAQAQAPNLDGADVVLKAIPAGPVARVNGIDIPQDEFISLYKQEIEMMKKRAQRQDVPDPVRLETALACLRMLIQRELLYQGAVAEKIVVPEKDLLEHWKSEMDRMRKGFSGSQGKDLSEEEVLQMAGATREEAMAELKKAILIEEMRKKIAAQKKIEPSTDEIKKFFNEHANEFKKAEKLHVNQIFVAYKPTGKPDDDKKKSEAVNKLENAIRRLQAGETFAAVAKAVSEAPDKERGGDLGPLPANVLPPFYVEAAKKLKPGELSSIIQSEFGFHVIKLIEMEEGGAVTYEQAEPHIRQMLIGDKLEQAVAEWCQSMQKPDSVELFLRLARMMESSPELQKAAAAALKKEKAEQPASSAPSTKAAPKTGKKTGKK